jgi:hypothetical protein
MEEKKINLSINEGSAFFSHEASINFSPSQFVLDFRCVTPRVDPRSNDAPTIHMAHNVILIDPYHAKRIYELLGEMLKKYEKDFGKIEKPKSVKMIEKRRKKEELEDQKEILPKETNYFG